MTVTLSPDFKRGRLTDAEKLQIDALSHRLTSGQIALKLNRKPATISFYMGINGLRRPRPVTWGPYTRGGRIVVPFKPEEDAFITALRIQHYSTTKIAALCTKRFGASRNASTIGVRLKMLANVEEAA